MYYETQCPFAKRFISSFEFRDTIYSMGSYMDIKLYPYGSAEVGTKKNNHPHQSVVGNPLLDIGRPHTMLGWKVLSHVVSKLSSFYKSMRGFSRPSRIMLSALKIGGTALVINCQRKFVFVTLRNYSSTVVTIRIFDSRCCASAIYRASWKYFFLSKMKSCHSNKITKKHA